MAKVKIVKGRTVIAEVVITVTAADANGLLPTKEQKGFAST